MKSIRDLLSYSALLGLAGISAWTFWNILLYGEFLWYDPDKGMVIWELIVSISLMGLAVERLVKLLR